MSENTQCELLQKKPEISNVSQYHPVDQLDFYDLSHAVKQLDTQRGAINMLFFENEYLLMDEDEITEFEDFWKTKYGSAISFCLPSWQSDVILSAAASSGANILSIYNSRSDLKTSDILYFEAEDGDYTRKILSATQTSITLDGVITEDLPAEYSMSKIYRVTFSSDTFTLNYTQPNIARVSLQFIETLRVDKTKVIT